MAEARGISFATTLACVALLYRLQPHMRELEGHLIHLAQLEPEMRAVLGMLDQAGAAGPPAGGLPFAGMREGVRFAEVTFTHPGAARPALAGVSFSIPVGRTTAIVGESGAGKTTIVNLLLRLYAADAGAVLVDGVPLERLSRPDWLSRTAVAGQDVELIDGTVAENIRMARPEAGDAEVRAAAALAGALGFIEALPEGFESWIGQQGLNLSGGQRQRLGIARAVLRDPDLLILDEATNALDAALEDGIRARLRRAFAGRTLVLVTHREDVALTADHVVRLQGGGLSPRARRMRSSARFARRWARRRQKHELAHLTVHRFPMPEMEVEGRSGSTHTAPGMKGHRHPAVPGEMRPVSAQIVPSAAPRDSASRVLVPKDQWSVLQGLGLRLKLRLDRIERLANGTDSCDREAHVRHGAYVIHHGAVYAGGTRPRLESCYIPR